MFTDRLRLTLTLASGSHTFAYPAGSVERLELEARPYGFEADVAFHVSSEQEADELFELFVSADIIKATLAISTCVLDGSGSEPTALVVTGYVLDKDVGEQVSDEIAGSPVVDRRYRVRFVDPAAAFWRQHWPLDLFVDASVQDVLERYKTQGMDLSYDWTALSQKQDMICVAAGGDGPASFYDWVFWYVARGGGVVELDAASGAYRLGQAKRRSASPAPLAAQAIDHITLAFPGVSRHATRVLNSYSEGPQTIAVANEQAVVGVSRDVLLRTPIASLVADRQRIEAQKLRLPAHELLVSFARCPEQLYGPGAFVKPAEGFSDKIFSAGKSYRIVELRVSVHPSAADQSDLIDLTKVFEVELSTRLELSSSPRPHLPAHAAPRYPVLVEGKVVSLGGGASDRTWMAISNSDDSITRYEVEIPLWNKKVLAPFEPNHLSGHFFFPAFKAQRVLVALSFDAAAIRGYLDWAANARMPLDTQGNRIVLGYQDINGTVIDHAYLDSKPALTIARTFGNDHQTIVVKDGSMFFEVKEDITAQALEPTYDVTVVVTASQGQVRGQVQDAIDRVTSSFESSTGGVNSSLDAAVEQLDGALSGAESKLVGKIEQAEASLQELSSALVAITAALSDAVFQAKAALAAALA